MCGFFCEFLVLLGSVDDLGDFCCISVHCCLDVVDQFVVVSDDLVQPALVRMVGAGELVVVVRFEYFYGWWFFIGECVEIWI